MSDIFVSYSSHDRERAALVARALEARGWSVWWDRTIPPGRQYDEVIEEALGDARCVVVLWSKASAQSNWVKNEASDAMSKKALIPALIEDEVKIPFEFRRIQAADLSRWQGEATVPEFVQFCDAIAGEIDAVDKGRPPRPAPAPAPARDERAQAAPFAAPPRPTPAVGAPAGPVWPAAPPASRKKLYIFGGIAAFFVLGIISMLTQPQPQPQTGSPTLPQIDSMPSPQRAPAVGGLAIGASNGIRQNLSWRDDVLSYAGNVSWDGISDDAMVLVNVVDGASQRSLGMRQLQATVSPNGNNQIVVSTSVPVPGDSRTPGPHSHNIHLVFQSRGNGEWGFVHNCKSQTDCY